MTEAMAGDYSKKLRALRALCRAGESEDVTVREFLSMGRRAALFYVDGIASSADIDRFLLRPLLTAAAPEAGADLSSHLLSHVLPVASVKRTDRYGDAIARIFSGDAALILEGMDGALTADALQGEIRDVLVRLQSLGCDALGFSAAAAGQFLTLEAWEGRGLSAAYADAEIEVRLSVRCLEE